METWTQMIDSMEELVDLLKSDAKVDDKINKFERFVEDRESWFDKNQDKVNSLATKQEIEHYFELDRAIKGFIENLLNDLTTLMVNVSDSKQLTRTTKKAHHGYLKQKPTSGGYFFDKKK